MIYRFTEVLNDLVNYFLLGDILLLEDWKQANHLSDDLAMEFTTNESGDRIFAEGIVIPMTCIENYPYTILFNLSGDRPELCKERNRLQLRKSGYSLKVDHNMKEYLNTNFSDIVYGENGFLVELRCNNTFQVQLFGKIKAYLLENQPAWKAAGAIPIPDAVAIFNLIDQLAGGNRFWGEETGRQAEDALFELQEIIGSLEESPECE